ncbi:kinesin-like protein KIF26B isoform X1 [Astyanax mexicanus]|uniref:Kinesin-like protein KIF26B isoform X1 n=1 Tax=Astyanax mexicanus TaxID=7994 RepID=A0A8T2MHI5_ASTMX|nr:kinesin-like protein KIF26B isoform X1 [Astyanax mexicanus]
MMGSSEVARSQGYLTRAPRAKPASRSSSVPRAHRPPPEGAGAGIHGESQVGPRGTGDHSPRVCARGGRVPTEPWGTKVESWSRLDSARLCVECASRVETLLQEAQRLLSSGHFNTSDPKLSVLLYESVQVPAWSSFAGRCDVCSTHLSQLKREAIRMLLTQNRAIWPAPSPASVSPGHSTSGAHTLPRACSSQSPRPSPRHRPSNLRTDSWVREQQHFETLYPPASIEDGDPSFAQTSQDALKNNKEDEKATSSSTVLCHFSSPLPFNASRVTTLLPAGTSAAVSFIVRAVQKLNLTARRRKQSNYCSRYPTNFSGLLQRTPPPAPSNLLQTACKGRDISETGKVKVMLRVSPLLMTGASQSPAIKLDLRKKQVTVLEPATQSTQRPSAGATFTPKTFTFDAAFGPDSSQAEVCERSLFEVLQSVVAGSDGCILSFGQTKVGTSYTMIGRDDCSANLGIIPCAISWLFKLITKKKDRTWANISVCVSAVEVCGETEVIRDLLADVESGDCKDTKPNIYLREDPVCGIQVCNNNVLSAPTAERAAFLLDAALASRGSGGAGGGSTPEHHCHMFYTLHVCQQHIEGSTKTGMSVDQSKLSLIDLGCCTTERNKNNAAVCLVDLGNVIMTKLNGRKHVPKKGSKLAMLMQESLNNVNCHTTIVAHVSTLPEDLSETLCTIQIVSQIRRLQRRSRKSSSNSPGGRSSGIEKKANDSSRLRAFHSASTLDRDFSLPSLFDESEDHSKSEKSCDSVICVDPSGFVRLHEEHRGNQEFVPIIPSLQRSKTDFKGYSLLKHCDFLKPISQCTLKKETQKQDIHQKPLPDLECLKCNTFAELQDRLGCIDGSDLVVLNSCKEQPTKNVTKSEPLLRKVIKVPIGESEVHRSPVKKDFSERGIRHLLKKDTLVKDTEETLHRFSGQAKNNPENNPCFSPRLDALSNSVQCEQATGCQSLIETMDTSLSLPFPVEEIPSEDSTLPSEIRISPVGKSSSSSFSAGLASPVSLPITLSESNPQFPMETQSEMKATITVTVQQPLDVNGHDELIYSVIEEVTINGADNKNKAAKIVSITDPHSLEGVPPGMQTVRIIGSVGKEQPSIGSVSEVQALDQVCKSSGGKTIPLVQNFVDSSQVNDSSQLVTIPEDFQNIMKDVSEDALCLTLKYEVSEIKEYSSEIGPEQKTTEKRMCDQSNVQLSREIGGNISTVKPRLSADCKMKMPENPVSSNSSIGKTNPAGEWQSLHKQYDSQDSLHPCVNSHSSRATLEREECSVNLCHTEWTEDSESVSSGQESDRDKSTKRMERHPQPSSAQCLMLDSMLNKINPIEESSKLFSAKLEQLANRNQSLSKSHLECFDLQLIEESNSVFTQGSSSRVGSCCTSPRIKKRHIEQGHFMTFGSKASLDGDYALAQAKCMTPPGVREFFNEDLSVSRAGRSFRRVPRFFPMYDAVADDTTQLPKGSESKMSAGSKLLSSSKVSKMSGANPKNLCPSPKSSRHSISRSSSLSPDGLSIKHISWSSQSLSRKQGKASISSKPLSRALNGRIELLRASGDSLSSSSQGSLDMDEPEQSNGRLKSLNSPLPSPYSRITAPRKPNHCSGHASDNTSVLSGELPPAMCKTALLYNRNSMVSSGYESMVRDSEATCSSTSIHDSISDQSCFFNAASGARISKKSKSIGLQQRRPSQDTLLTLRRSASGSAKIRWVDRGTPDSYEIKVYEIDNVDGLQKRGKAGNKSVVCFSAKLKFLEHRQQRIAEVRAKYSALKRELELAKQHLMVDPGRWTREFDLWQTFEVDSLEHLEALQLVTERLESQVSRCKACVMMVTCFDATPKRRQKKRYRPPVEYKMFMGI